MSHKPNEIESVLQAKYCFTRSRHHESGHKWYELKLPGLPVIATYISRNDNEVGPRLLAQMARQLRVRKPFFEEMIGCTQSREAYYQKVQDDPYPPFYVRF